MDAQPDRHDRRGARRSSETIAVEFDRVTIAIGGNTILSDVSLQVASGELVGVLGANGAGKTTVMRAILGLITPISGRITVLGKPVVRGHRKIGYLPQTRTAPAATRLTGYDFLASSIRGHRLGVPFLTAEDAREIDRAVALVGAGDLVRRPLNALSGGERQRVLLAQVLMGRPALLLLDEPLIGLDPRQQQVVVDVVRGLASDLGLTVLFSAHELSQLLPAIDRVLYLGNRQAALGTVDEVVTPAVMSRLYGAPIDVVRVGGRIFVLSNGRDIESHHHDHPHHDHHHADDDHVRV
jgi:zinc/manganese transport system ATP-binding protein